MGEKFESNSFEIFPELVFVLSVSTDYLGLFYVFGVMFEELYEAFRLNFMKRHGKATNCTYI